MEAQSIKAIAEYLVTTQSSIEEAMHDFWGRDFLNDVKLGFGKEKGKYLAELPQDYLKWIEAECVKFLQTHSVNGVSLYL